VPTEASNIIVATFPSLNVCDCTGKMGSRLTLDFTGKTGHRKTLCSRMTFSLRNRYRNSPESHTIV
jgi:hypothetical protein